MNEKIGMLDRYLISENARLDSGEVLTVKLNNGFLTIYRELNADTGEKKTITLVEKFNAQLEIEIEDLISVPRWEGIS